MRSAALIGVVADENIARLHLRNRMALQDMREDADETAEMHRNVLGLAQRLTTRVEQRGRAIPPLLDVGGIAGAHQRLAHFLGDRGQRAADHLDRNRIDPLTHIASLTPSHCCEQGALRQDLRQQDGIA